MLLMAGFAPVSYWITLGARRARLVTFTAVCDRVRALTWATAAPNARAVVRAGLVFVIGLGTAVLQSSLFGYASQFPPIFNQSLMAGQVCPRPPLPRAPQRACHVPLG